MPIVGGLDICRGQITFDYVDRVSGQVRCGQIGHADRARLRTWLGKNFAGRDDVAFAVEACTGWRYVQEELGAAGIEVHLGRAGRDGRGAGQEAAGQD